MLDNFTYIYESQAKSSISVTILIDIVQKAAQEILKVYERDYKIEIKEDQSPVTEADKHSNTIIVEELFRNFPDIPVLSEEIKHADYRSRKGWNPLWLVDPLDGTKEFINKNGEFTINIALIQQNKPVIGVIHVPVNGITYFAVKGQGAYKLNINNNLEKIAANPMPVAGKVIVVASRSHKNKALEDYVNQLKLEYEEVEYISTGSALKMCLIAEGKADIYPRLGPCMEWDTAAGHTIINESGKKVYIFDSDKELTYNKEDLRNPCFICK